MKRLQILLTILLLLVLTTIVNADNLLQDKEILLEERIKPNGIKEIFTERDDEYYKKTIKDEEVIEVEKLKLMPTGLKDNPKYKDESIGIAVSNKLDKLGISSYDMPYKLDYSDSQYLPPVGRQMENSCVGWSVGYYLRTYQQGMDLGWQIKSGEAAISSRVFSPTFIYNQINAGTDDGAYMEDAGELLKRTGASPLENFPYVQGDYLTQPDSEAIQAAYTHRVRDWRVLYTNNDSSDYIIQKTKEYLNTEDLMVAGIEVGFKFNYPYFDEYDNAIITTDNTAGFGHAVVVVGYDDNIETPEGYGAFKIINSYGKEWGNDGFAYMSYKAFTTNIRAGYVFTDLINDNYIPTIENLKVQLISEEKYKVSFDKIENISGYRLLDENKRVISNFYRNEYTDTLDKTAITVRYIQPFKEDILGEMRKIEIDLNNRVEEAIQVEIQDTVEFNMNFSGSGRYDIRIKDALGNTIKEDLNNKGTSGLNIYTLNGKDDLSNIVSDGSYKLELTPYKGTEAKAPFLLDFEKKSKVENASAKSYKLGESIYKVEVSVTAKEDGKVFVYAVNGNSEELIISDNPISSGENKIYKVDGSKLDLNNSTSIEVVIK